MDPPPVDLLSSFPEHLKDEILTYLDIRDAVRTSALSRAWRRRWETIPRLALSFPDGTPPSAVDGVLLRYAGPCVSRFATHFYGDGDAAASASHVGHWLIALSRRSVESISIFNQSEQILTLHSSIFSCDRLVSLSLEECTIPLLPQPGAGFAGFPLLKELYLTAVDFVGEGESQLQAMIRASPMLRVLFLEDLEPSTDCVIEAPNLHTLGLISSSRCRFGDLPHLQYASINVPAFLLGGSAGFAEFVTGVSQVQKLIFNIEFCDYRQTSMDATPFTLSNLRSMELLTDFDDMHNILLMFFLLRISPNLEKFKIELRQPKTVANWTKFLNEQWTDGMCANLQVVEITSAKGWLHEAYSFQSMPSFSFMKLILSKACCLRTLSVDKCPVSQDDPLNELLNCRRASPQAEVQFKVQLEGIRFDRMKFSENRLN